MFKSIELKTRMVVKAELIQATKVSEWLERNESNGRLILKAKGSNPLKLTVADLTVLLTWHQHQKVAGMNKAAKVLAWKGIVDKNWQLSLFSRWTEAGGGIGYHGYDWPYSPRKNGSHEEEGVGVGGGSYVERGVRSITAGSGEATADN